MAHFLDLVVCASLSPHVGRLLLLHIELFAFTLLHLNLIREISSVSTLNLLCSISSWRLSYILLEFLLCSPDSVWDRPYTIAILTLIYGFCLNIFLSHRRNSVKVVCRGGLSVTLADLLVWAILPRSKVLPLLARCLWTILLLQRVPIRLLGMLLSRNHDSIDNILVLIKTEFLVLVIECLLHSCLSPRSTGIQSFFTNKSSSSLFREGRRVCHVLLLRASTFIFLKSG